MNRKSALLARLGRQPVQLFHPFYGFSQSNQPPSSRPRPGSESEVPSTLGGTGEWLMYLITLDGVLPGPTRATEVLEAVKVAAEVRAHHAVAHGAERIL